MRIDELRLRLPHMSAQQARRVAESVASKLAGSSGRERRPAAELRVRIPAEPGLGPVELAGRIAARILEGLR